MGDGQHAWASAEWLLMMRALFVREEADPDDEPVSGPGELADVLLRKMSVEQKRELIIEPHYQAKHGTVVAVTEEDGDTPPELPSWRWAWVNTRFQSWASKWLSSFGR